MNTDSPTPNGSAESSSAATHARRSREEMEALAKNFVGTPTEEPILPAKPSARLAIMGGGAAALVAVVLAVVFWPKAGKDEAVARNPAETSRAAAEAEQYRQRFEAERERKRQELASGKDYLERMAAADAALMKDLSDSAGALAERAARAPAPAPAPSDQPPTPRDTSAKPAAAKAAPAPAPAQTTPATTASAAPAKPAPAAETPKAEPAAAAPAEVAQVDKSECSIHVSELSKSGKLTYADVKRMKGARIDEDTGNVFTPPVQTGGRTVIFEVFPTGCVQLVRSSLGR